MKIKYILFLLYIINIILSNDNDYNNIREDHIENTINELGYSDRESLTKPEFQKFFFQ